MDLGLPRNANASCGLRLVFRSGVRCTPESGVLLDISVFQCWESGLIRTDKNGVPSWPGRDFLPKLINTAEAAILESPMIYRLQSYQD